jgi:DNA repair exonuclease SbcCD ATPase subunit
MLNNDTSTIKLTDEQTIQITEVKTRVMNLESEVSIATKNLKSIKGESERAIKDKAYQEELLANVKTQVEEEQKQLNYLISEIANSNTILTKLNTEINIKTETQAKKDKEFSERETTLIQREKEYADKSKKLDENNQIFKGQIDTHNSKVAKLKEVISTF